MIVTWLLALAVALFDGSSFAGWSVVGEAAWKIEAGDAGAEIVAAGTGDGFLRTDAEYGDFELRLEFWVDATTNSGIMIRCKDSQRIHPDTCYELNIWDLHPQQPARTGAIVFVAMPPLVQVDTIGKWNSYEVLARGGQLVVKVNGETTAMIEDADPTPGFIALQHWQTGTVRFRNITLKTNKEF